MCPGDPFIGNFMLMISDKLKDTSESYLKRADEVIKVIGNVGHLATPGKSSQLKTPIFESPNILKEVDASFEKEMQKRCRFSFEAPSFSFGVFTRTKWSFHR